MKYFVIFLILIGFAGVIIPHAYAACAAEELEWWEACNDTGRNNALTLNPVLIWVISGMVILVSISGIVVWRKRK